MNRALETHSKRGVFYLIFLSLSILTVNCDEDSTNSNSIAVCDDGVVSGHFYYCFTYIIGFQ